MSYMFEVFLVISVPIFVLAGSLILGWTAWTHVKDYARARVVMRRIIAAADRKRPAPARSTTPAADSLRVA